MFARGGTSIKNREGRGRSMSPIACLVGAVLHEPAFGDIAQVGSAAATPAAQRDNRRHRSNATHDNGPHGITSQGIVCCGVPDGCTVLNMQPVQ